VATQRAIVSICLSESRRSPAKSPRPASGFQGGMYRLAVTSAICAACRRTSSYVSRLNGAGPSGWWHDAHCPYTIGAMSLVNVIGRSDEREDARVCGTATAELAIRRTPVAAVRHFTFLDAFTAIHRIDAV
jgi:hypothetical protein